MLLIIIKDSKEPLLMRALSICPYLVDLKWKLQKPHIV